MIQLTRLNGIPIVLNSDLIKTAESSPDTMITLISGEKLIVKETCDDINERVLEYRAKLLTLVSRRLPSLKELQPAASLASLDIGDSRVGKSPSKPTFGKAEN